MRALVFTSLFPNHLRPNFGIFVKQRMFHFAGRPGCGIEVAAPVPYSPSRGIPGKWSDYSRVAKSEMMDGIRVHHPRYPLIPKVSMPLHGFLMFLGSVRLVSSIRKQRPFDLIDGHYIYPDGFAAILLGKMLRMPVVLSARGSDINQFANFKSIRPLIKYCLLNADQIISVSEALKNRMVDLGASSAKIRTIPNGVDLENFQPMDRGQARRELSLHGEGRIIVSVGALVPLKGFDILIDAFAALVREDKSMRLYVIGEGPHRPKLEQKIRMLGLDECVVLAGERPNRELKKWYGAADVFCLASSREGWANVIMEALACGVPVVATDVGGAPDIITHDGVGFLVERTPGGLAEGLEKALCRTWDRGRIRRHVEGRSWSCVAEEVGGIFEKAIQGNPAFGISCRRAESINKTGGI